MARVPGPPVPVTPVALADHRAALAWLDAERANLVASVGIAPGGWRLVDALRGYFSTRFPREDWAAAAKAGLAVAVAEESAPGRAAMHLSLGHLAWCDGRLTDSLRHYRAARTWSERANWREGESTALSGVGRAEIGLGRPEEALGTLADALAIDRTISFRAGEARELHNIGLAHQSLGRLADAVDHQERALTLYEELGDRRGRCLVADNLGLVRRLTDPADPAGEPLEARSEALTLGADIGWPHAQAEALRALAAAHLDADRFAEARGYADRAVALARVGGEHHVRVGALNVLGDALAGARPVRRRGPLLHRGAERDERVRFRGRPRRRAAGARRPAAAQGPAGGGAAVGRAGAHLGEQAPAAGPRGAGADRAGRGDRLARAPRGGGPARRAGARHPPRHRAPAGRGPRAAVVGRTGRARPDVE